MIVQVFIAGLAVFTDPINWGRHTSFVHFFELLPVLMFILAFVGKVPKSLRWQSLGMFGLIFLQYATANMGGISGMIPAIHPVIALILFWWSVSLALRSWKEINN